MCHSETFIYKHSRMSDIDQLDSDPETDVEFPVPKAEPEEDNPPDLAVHGFRPVDYTKDSFHVGTRIR